MKLFASVCVSMCVYIYIYSVHIIHTYIHIYIYIQTNIQMYVIYVHTYACTCRLQGGFYQQMLKLLERGHMHNVHICTHTYVIYVCTHICMQAARRILSPDARSPPTGARPPATQKMVPDASMDEDRRREEIARMQEQRREEMEKKMVAQVCVWVWVWVCSIEGT
jgi:hypothetical protein